MKDKEMNFEKALAELEQTVEKLETGGLSLNESLGLFERGVKLARFLRSELDKAEKKVELLLKDAKGDIQGAEPFAVEDEAGVGSEAAEPDAGSESKKPHPRGRKKSGDGDDDLPF